MNENKKRTKRYETRGRKSCWNHAPTTAIRVPAMFADALLEIAREMDEGVFLYNKKQEQQSEQLEASILYKINNKKSKGDERSKSPAIVAYREIVGRYPNKALYDQVIEVLGDAPDTALLSRCYVEAAKRNLTHRLDIWFFEWIPSGGPKEARGNGRKEISSAQSSKYAGRG